YDSIIEEGCEFIINEIDGHHVAYIEVKKLAFDELLETAEQKEA
ncbi:hypothetical protein, partial [Paenibacillus amylolyticus]